MRRPRIAVCLFGQFRTGDYCLPWIRTQYESFADVDWYIHTKAYDTYTNASAEDKDAGSKLKIVHDVSASLKRHFAAPASNSRVMHEVVWSLVEDGFLTPGYWHYAPMFASMQRTVCSALNNFERYDWIVAQRPDILLGPTPLTMKTVIEREPRHSGNTIWSIDPYMGRIPGEARHGGIHDVFLAGQPAAMSQLIAGTFAVTCSPSPTDWLQHQFSGPNLFLKDCAVQANLRVENMPLALAIVRPNADLSKAAERSFLYHQQFWVKNHPGMQQS